MSSFVQTFTGAPLDVTAGRVAVVDVGALALRVTTPPAQSNVTVNPDGTLAVVLTDPAYRGPLSFSVEVSGANGPQTIKVALNVGAGSQDGGWGRGDHYMLQTDAQGDTVVEPGRDHRKVYVSESSKALSISDIAKLEGVSAGAIDGAWLAAHPQYGASENMALDTQAGMALWYELTNGWKGAPPASNWLLFERGYQYANTNRLVAPGANGESELHPLVIGAWGNGARPVVEDYFGIIQSVSRNIVVKDIEFLNAARALLGENILFEDLKISASDNAGVNIENVDRFTLLDSQVIDVIRDNPRGDGSWPPISGVYIDRTDGVLIDGVLVDHSGWADGYETNSSLMPANATSHNIYIQYNSTDVTFRDNVSMRASSLGTQVRPGGFVEGNLFADNNVAFNLIGGNFKGAGFIGNYSLVLDNVVTSAGHKQGGGALSWGIDNKAADTSLVRNIIAHLADPADPAERQSKTVPGPALINGLPPFVDDTIIYNWITDLYRTSTWYKDPEKNLPNIPTSLLDEVTLRRFFESATGQSAPADDVDALADWLSANWDNLDGASSVVDFFQQGFGIGQTARGSATTLRFVPDPVGEGTRWDNRLNWSTDDLPGTAAGDSVDLHGNWVDYAGTTVLQALDLGDRGKLVVRQGYLETGRLDVGQQGGSLEVGLAGQFWTDGYGDADLLTVTVDGGRFANTGSFDGDADLVVSNGEVLLATAGARFTVNGALSIVGDAALVGFDGQGGGTATLDFGSSGTLNFTAAAGGFSALGEFRSGHYGTATPDVRSTIDFGGADLSLDLAALALGSSPKTYTLAAADTMLGGFDSVSLRGMSASRVDLALDLASDRLTLTTDPNGQGSQPGLDLVGSAASEIFHLAAGAEMHVRSYQAQDVIDVSALLDQGAAGSLRIAQGSGNQIVLSGQSGGRTVQFAAIESSASEVTVTAGGQSRLLRLDGSSQPAPTPTPAPNAAPVAQDGMFSGDADAVTSGSLVATDADGDALSFALASGPSAGTVTLAADGSFSYDPASAYDTLPQGQTATETFTYRVSDGRGGSDTGTATLTIHSAAAPAPAPTNGDPVARDDAARTAEGTATTIAVLGNDSDPDGDMLDLGPFAQPANGSVTDNGDGTLHYVPNPGFSGTDSFGYTAIDGRGGSASATVDVTVDPAPSGAPAVQAINAAGEGFTATDGTAFVADRYVSGGRTYSVNVDIAQTADDAIYQSERFGDFSYAIPVADGDYDVTLKFAEIYYDRPGARLFDVMAEGVLVLDDFDIWTAAGGKNIAHDVVVPVSVVDGTLNLGFRTELDNAKLSAIAIAPASAASPTPTPAPNAAPVAQDGMFSGDADAVTSGSLVATDADGDALSFALASGPSAGTVTLAADGSFSYDPASAYDTLPQGQTATETFTYRVSDGRGGSDTGTATLTIHSAAAPAPAPTNGDPVARDDAARTAEGTATTIAVLGNDSDPDGDMLDLGPFAQPANGSVTDNGDGTLHYVPNPGFSGTDSFGYTAIDGRGGSASATVDVTVDPAPSGAPAVQAINAAGEGFTATDGTAFVADRYVSGGRTYSVNVDIAQTADDAIYQSERFGDFSYAIPVADGDYDVTLKFAEIYYDRPGARLFDVMAEGVLVLDDFDIWTAAGGKNIAHDVVVPVSVVDGTLNLGFRTELDNAKLSAIAIAPASAASPTPTPAPNAAPVAQDGMFSGDADAVTSGSLVATDADGDALSFALASGPSAGTVTLAADGSFSYDPASAYDTLPQGQTATETFTYRVSDGRGGSDTGTATLTIHSAAAPASTVNVISGTAGWDTLRGTEGPDVIRSGGGGYDRIWGDSGADAFVFGAEVRNGRTDYAHILDFEPGTDMLVLEHGAAVEAVLEEENSVGIRLEGSPDDWIIVNGPGVTLDGLHLIQTEGIWIG